MAIKSMKLHRSTSYEKEDGCNCCFWILVTSSIVLIMLLTASLYLLHNCNEYNGYFSGSDTLTDDDEIKLQLYLLESNYYIDELDKEEVKLANIAKDYKMAKRYAMKREPNCVKKLLGSDSNEFEKIQESAELSIKKFKELLSNWNDNIDYMDIDRTIPSILNQYQEVYFERGNWKKENIYKSWHQLKEFYTKAINEIEECVTPKYFDELEVIPYIRNQTIEIENELNEKLKQIDDLDKELIIAINSVLPLNVKCLYGFPQKWGMIQSEEIFAVRDVQVLIFKLKQIRYKLMIADTPENLDFLVQWEKDFSSNKKERYRQTIDNHYEKAKTIQRSLLNQIEKCPNTEG